MQFQRFLGRNHTRIDPGRQSQSSSAVKVGQTLWRRCKLHAAHLEETGLAVVAKAVELLNGLAGELRHGTRTIGLEDDARRVRCGAAGFPELTFFNYDYVVIPAVG